MSISYSRPQEIQNNIAGQLCHQYVTERVVRPKSLKDGLFTSAANDNIDSNPSSTTANSAFHGTSISIFQHPKEDCPNEPFILDINSDFEHEKATLPSFYTNIEPTKDGKPRPPATHATSMSTGDRKVIEEAEEWLSKLISPEIPLSERISFSGFYSKKEISTQHKCINELLPLLEHSFKSLGMVNHCMMLVEKLVSSINSHQDPVITADQPVYALGKQIQWMYYDRFKNFVWMMGFLHVEMGLSNAIGD